MLSFITSQSIAQIAIDGDLSDWSSIGVLASDPSGDSSGVFDITQVKAVGQGGILYVQFDTTAIRNLLNDTAEAERLSAAGRRRVENLTWSGTARNTRAIYDEAIRGK